MRVLLVSHAFPPLNAVGAVRVGKFASYLHQAGHDVRVVAAPPAGDQSLVVDFPLDQVAYANERAVEPALSRVVKRIRAFPHEFRGGTATPGVAEPAASARTGLSAVLARHYSALLRIPDARAGWIGAATVAGREIARGWRPDLVFASAPPYSALIAASRIARAFGVPWIAELRDLWAGNPYSADPAWRRWIDRFLEWRVLRSATALVTISPSCAAALRRRHRQPIACVLNGYVEEDFPAQPSGPPPGEVVSILYTGGIYPGYRDPSPLFRAIAGLGTAERQRIGVHFYGPPPQEVAPLAAEHGVGDRVVVHDPVPYKASLALQTCADVLLLLQWNDERDAGTLPAKFFEYLGARRPILSLGYERGDLAAMIRERAAGLVANDPEVIAQQLRRWIAQKPAGIAPVAPQARAGLTRAEQYAGLELFLTEISRTA